VIRQTLPLLAVVTLCASAPGLAQDSLPKALPIDVKKLMPHRDSMTVLVNNQPQGSSVWGLRRAGDTLVVFENTDIGTFMRQQTTVDLGARGEMERVSQSGMVRGIPGGIEIRYADGRVTGQVQAVTGTGADHFTVDTTVPEGIVDDNVVQALLPALPWSKNAGWNFSMYSAGTNSVTVMALYVVAEETAMVPAGAFDAWRVRLSGGKTSVDFLVLKRAPHTVLKVEMSGAPLKFELVSGGGL
jgi:hypothetical protein